MWKIWIVVQTESCWFILQETKYEKPSNTSEFLAPLQFLILGLLVKKFLGLGSKVLLLMFHFPGQNCLHLASVQGYLSLVENMVDLGADINAKVNNTRSHTLLV